MSTQPGNECPDSRRLADGVLHRARAHCKVAQRVRRPPEEPRGPRGRLLRQSHQQLSTANSDGFLNRLDIPPICQVAERPARLQAQFSDEQRGNAWAR